MDSAPETGSGGGSGPTWGRDMAPPTLRALGPRDWLRVLRRGLPLGVITFGGLGVLLALRLIERPLHGFHRPWTPHITQAVCRAAFRCLGMGHHVSGQPRNGPGATVANHASWLDIFALNAGQRVYFVSKAEVAGWPGIGWLARATGTLFIRRDRAEAAAQTAILQARLAAGHRLLFFPEGTSTDGRRVLPFMPTLFQAFFAAPLRDSLEVQPVSVIYYAPPGADPRHYGWWGDMEFGTHLLHTLATARQGRVELIYHPPQRVADHASRKTLAHACQDAVTGPFDFDTDQHGGAGSHGAGSDAAGPDRDRPDEARPEQDRT